MIQLTKLDDRRLVLNDDLIEFIESTPDTVITLTTGRKIIVKEQVEDIIDDIVNYRRRLYAR
jgi:flagellar protein FlbD